MPRFDSSLISVIIPAYNEEERIGYTLREIKEYFEKKRWKGEIIVVDDGSTDHTSEVVEEEKKDIPNLFLLKNEKNEGKGEAVKKGMLSAKGDWLFFSDADLSTPIEEMDKLLFFLKEGWEVVIASRALPGAKVFPRQPFFRELSGKIFNLMVRTLLLPGIRDTQCGFKGFSREAARKIFRLQTLKGFAFDVEILYIGRKLGYKIKEIPVSWRNSPSSRVKFFRHSWKMGGEILKVRKNIRKGLYKLKGGR